MNYFLIVVAAFPCLNMTAVLIALLTNGGLPPANEAHRLIDAIVTACFGVWALCLFFR